MQVKDKNVLITGASGGIGSKIADTMSKNGANLFLQYNKHPIQPDRYQTAKLIQCDVTTPGGIVEMFESIDRLDVLVNVIGIEIKNSDSLDLATWRAVFETDLFAAVEIARNSLQKMDSGVIVNISSIVGNPNVTFSGASGDSLAYPAAKAALNKLTEGIAATFAPKIRAVSISPGYVKTQMWEVFSETDIKNCVEDIPLKKFVTAEEVASLVLQVVENDSLTGCNLTLDGGLGMRIIY